MRLSPSKKQASNGSATCRAGSDAVRATIDGRSGAVLQLTADPTAGAAFRVPGAAAFLAALGLIAGATALAWRNIERVPALPSRVAVSRLLPVQAAR